MKKVNYLMKLILICILIVLSAQASAESAIPGWGKAKWGMAHSAVKKHFDLNPWEPGSTPTCKLKKKIRIWGRDFGVAFYFDERSAGGKLPRTPADIEPDRERILTATQLGIPPRCPGGLDPGRASRRVAVTLLSIRRGRASGTGKTLHNYADLLEPTGGLEPPTC